MTAQWLNLSCAVAAPAVRFHSSSAKLKLSATGSSAVMRCMS